jgi:hypothetical protein
MDSLATPKSTVELRAELMLLRARYDGGAVSAAVYVVIRGLEVDIAWIEHARSQKKAVR